MIIHERHAKGMVLGESFQVAVVIEKLPPTWKDFKNYLKYKRKEMSMEDLVVRLRIEEDNKRYDKKGVHTSPEVKANFVEHGSMKRQNNKGKGSKLGHKGEVSTSERK